MAPPPILVGGGGVWETLPRSRFGGRFSKYKINHARGGSAFAKYGDQASHWDFAPEPEYFKELFRVSDYQIIWGGNYFDLPPSRNFIIWKKLTISENFSMAMAEYAWTNISGNSKIFECAPQDKWRFHPTQKPQKLYSWILERYAQPGWRILDTHLGSGTHALACMDRGFDLTACEIDEYYFSQSIKMMREYCAQGLLFPGGGNESPAPDLFEGF
jgi:site-specific DNA-methyltransferase (adenine-specific)